MPTYAPLCLFFLTREEAQRDMQSAREGDGNAINSHSECIDCSVTHSLTET